MSFGNLVYALSKLDKSAQQEDMQTLKILVASDQAGKLAPFASLLRESNQQPGEQTSGWGTPSARHLRWEETEQTKKRFIKLLLRVARAKEGISRQEQVFLQAFWRQIPRRQVL